MQASVASRLFQGQRLDSACIGESHKTWGRGNVKQYTTGNTVLTDEVHEKQSIPCNILEHGTLDIKENQIISHSKTKIRNNYERKCPITIRQLIIYSDMDGAFQIVQVKVYILQALLQSY